MTFLLPILAIATLSLGLAVFYRATHLWTHRLFALFTFATSFWACAVFLGLTGSTTFPLSVAAPMAFASPPLAVYALLLFFEAFEQPTVFPSNFTTRVMGLFASLCALSAFTPVLLLTTGANRNPSAIHGPFHPYYAICLLVLFLAAFTSYLRQQQRARGLKRLQLKYLALGLLLPGSLACVTNLIIPLFFGTSRFSVYGPLLTLVMIAFLAHAMVHHHLLDLRTLIGRGTIHLLSTFVSGSFLLGFGLLIEHALSSLLSLPSVFSRLALGALFVVSFNPLRHLVKRAMEKYLNRKALNFEEAVKEASRRFATPLTRSAISTFLVSTVTKHASPTWVGVYLQSCHSERHGEPSFTLVSSHGAPPKPCSGDAIGRLITSATSSIQSSYIGQDGSTSGKVVNDLVTSDIAIPISDGNSLIGVIGAGAKSSGDPFFSDEIDLITTIANQAGVAIRNAQLYEQLVLLNQYLENIVSTIDSGVVAVGEGDQVTMFNSAAEKLTGLYRETMVGRTLRELPEAVAEPLRVTLGNGLPRLVPEAELLRAARPPIPVICSTSPLRGPSGTLVGAVAVFSDLTPLKELETERRRAERLAYFETLAAGIAHEIKNPLVAIKTFVQLLPRRFGDEPFREEFGRVAGREIGRMEHLVDRLRSLAKPGSRPYLPLDLEAPIRDALELLRPRLEEKQIAVQWASTLGGQPCRVIGDHAELEQLFLNLLINAMEAMDPGGTLTIRVGQANSAATVEVEDAGPGIHDDLLNRIFDPFVTTKLHGSGLGLAICASIAEAHRARIRAANKPGGTGAVFTVELPLRAHTTTSLKA